MIARPIALVAVIATALVADPVWAQRATDRTQAAARARQGQAYFQRGDFERALTEYQAALDLSGEPSLIFNIALCHDRANRPEQALDAFRRYIAAAPDGAAADEARTDIARLVPIVERITADRAAHEERLRQEAAEQAVRRAEAARRDEEAAAHRQRVSYYVMAAGLVVVAGGAATHVIALRTRDQSEASSDPEPHYTSRERFLLERNVAIGAYAVGGIAVATGLVLAYTARGRRDAPRVSAAITPDGAAVMVGWSSSRLPSWLR